jgi:hypothetical protein
LSRGLVAGRDRAFDRGPRGGDAGIDGKIDKYVDAKKTLDFPAPNPECLWLGKRVVSLLWRDDLDTAIRNLDLYDRFGCSTGQVQMAFRCVVRQGNIDLKASGVLNGRIHSCWINPNVDTIISPPAAASASVPISSSVLAYAALEKVFPLGGGFEVSVARVHQVSSLADLDSA